MYHTMLDTTDVVSAWGLEDANGAFLKIIDNVTRITRQEIITAPRYLAHPTRPVH